MTIGFSLQRKDVRVWTTQAVALSWKQKLQLDSQLPVCTRIRRHDVVIGRDLLRVRLQDRTELAFLDRPDLNA